MILGNLPPHHRLKTSNAQLIFLSLETHVSRFGWVVFWKDLSKILAYWQRMESLYHSQDKR